MGWATVINADFGKYRMGLENAEINPDDKYSSVNENRQYLYPSHSINDGAISVQNMGVIINMGDIPQGEWINAFGFKLYQDKTYTNKVAMCRFYGQTIINTPNNVERRYHMRWAIFDETTHNYTWIGNYYVEIGIGQEGQLQWKNIKCNLVFQVRQEVLPQEQGGTQKVIYGGIYCFANESNYGSDFTYVGLGMVGIGEKWHLSQYDPIKTEGKKKSPEYGDASQPGGGYNPDSAHGTFDDSSDTIGIDPKPGVGVTTMGFINVYKITQGQLQTLGEKLFPHFLPAEILDDPSQLSTPEMLAMMIKTLYGTLISPAGTTIKLADNLGIIDILMNGKLIDYVIDCHAIPTSISDSTVEGLKVGYRQFNDLQVAKATEDYVDVDCGELNIGEFFANFLDFSNVSCDLFLPFIGYVPIESEYWNGGTIKVVYRFNIVDGSFQAKVLSTSSKSKLTDTIIGQYGGVACVHYPITGLQYSNVVAGLVNGTVGAVTSGSSGDIGGVATSLANMAMLRPNNPMSNGFNASSSFLTNRTPYLVIKRPTPQFSETYPNEMGLPLNVTLSLSSVHGFTVIDNPILNIACSDKEYNEIISLLKSGVIF